MAALWLVTLQAPKRLVCASPRLEWTGPLAPSASLAPCDTPCRIKLRSAQHSVLRTGVTLQMALFLMGNADRYGDRR